MDEEQLKKLEEVLNLLEKCKIIIRNVEREMAAEMMRAENRRGTKP